MKSLKVADLFCGAGGTSEGLRRAAEQMGAELDLVAVNHWDLAIKSHTINHPNARHYCTGVDLVDPKELVPGGHLDLLVASPECTHHSTARGGRPVNEQSRATAWCVLRWADALTIDNILIENVPEFQSWGPVGDNGRPLKSKRGQMFQSFVRALRAMNYKVEYRVLCCADFGDPTTRKRLFLVAKRNNRKIAWPEPTHRDPRKAVGLTALDERTPWVPAREIIDWSIPSQSIFKRKKPLARKTLERIESGLVKFGGPNAEPFLIVLRNHMAGQSIDMPISTLSAGGTHVGLVEPQIIRYDKGNQTPVSDPMPTQTATEKFGLAEPHLIHYHSGEESKSKDRASEVDAPVPTLDCSNRYAVVEPHLISYNGNGGEHSIDDPAPTVTTHDRLAAVEPMVIQTDQTGSNGACVRPVSEPMFALTSARNLHLTEFILPHRKFDKMDTDSVDAPLRTVEATNGRHFQLAEPQAFILPHRQFEEDQPDSIDRPLRTIKANNGKDFQLSEPKPFLVPNFGERDGQSPRAQSVEDPLPAVTSHGAGAVVEPFIAELAHGDGEGDGSRRVKPLDETLGTITGKGTRALIQAVTAEDVEGLPWIDTEDGRLYLDIRLRMLKVHELAAAMSLNGYKLLGTTTDQVKQIGNAVPAETAKALCLALVGARSAENRRTA